MGVLEQEVLAGPTALLWGAGGVLWGLTLQGAVQGVGQGAEGAIGACLPDRKAAQIVFWYSFPRHIVLSQFITSFHGGHPVGLEGGFVRLDPGGSLGSLQR